MSTTRREFLTTTAAAAAGAATLATAARLGWAAAPLPPGVPAALPNADKSISDISELKTPESTKEGDMLFRTLGKTGEKISLLGLGGYHFANPRDPAESTRLLHKAVDSGVNFMDNCWDYHNGDSEVRMGNALKDGGYRKKVFLMTKIDGQTKAAAEKQINESLSRLQTDVVDLMQIHENVRMGDADRVFGPSGSIEALTAAQKAGKIRYIGFTGHRDPAIHLHMLDVAQKNNFHFDSCQMPLSILDAQFRSFAKDVVPRLVKEGTGVLAMKTLAGGAIFRAGGITATDCLHYSMTLPTSTVIVGMQSERELNDALNAVKTFKPLAADELAGLLTRTREAAARGAFETFKTSTGFDGTARRPDWLG
jgi:aryl-alcohol dehydrogenase-like predicted oxidoreductase